MATGTARPESRRDEARAGTVRAWDGPTRLFKWTLVALVLFSYFTYRSGALDWHIWNGYAILVLLVFRLLWGLVGSSTARFASWVASPARAVRHGADLLRGRSKRYLSHNPLGGWMIILLLALVAAQGITGLFTVDSNGVVGGPFANLDFGDPTPLQRFMSRWHHLVFYILLPFIALHILVNALYGSVKDDPVIGAMVTGEKPAANYADQQAMRPARQPTLRAAACLLVACLVVFGGVKLFGGELPGL